MPGQLPPESNPPQPQEAQAPEQEQGGDRASDIVINLQSGLGELQMLMKAQNLPEAEQVAQLKSDFESLIDSLGGKSGEAPGVSTPEAGISDSKPAL